MEIITAKTAGFCFGVERAVSTVYREADKSEGDVYTFGPIVHNAAVVDELQKKGVKVIGEDELKDGGGSQGTVIIRAHGAGRDSCDRLKKAFTEVVDATCPFVKKIHRIAGEASAQGRMVVIAGNQDHPEVKGIRGWCSGPTAVIGSTEDFAALKLQEGTAITVVAQTTFNNEKFQEIIDNLNKLHYDILCFNTVCNATQERQEEAKKIASQVDAMIVIGDVASSNTQKLVEICSERCSRTIFIRNTDDLKRENLHSVYKVGITAGASTPKHLIEEVQNYVRSEF